MSNVPGADEPPADYTEDDDATIFEALTDWDSEFEPEPYVSLDQPRRR